jgi:ribosomal protein S28E/S33
VADEQDTTQPTTTKAGPTETEFSAALLMIDRGKVHDDATTSLANLIEAVARTGTKGKITVVVEVEPQDPKTFEDTGVMIISGVVKEDLPRVKRAPSIVFSNGLRSITRDDPHRDGDPRERD